MKKLIAPPGNEEKSAPEGGNVNSSSAWPDSLVVHSPNRAESGLAGHTDRTSAAPAPSMPPDPFDPERLRLPADDDMALGVRELLVSVPYRKPSKEQLIRVHPDPTFRCTGGLIELKDDDSESFWVAPSIWPHLADEPTFGRRLVVTAITRQGLVFLWVLRLPGADSKVPDWVSIPHKAAREAETKSVKMFWDHSHRHHRHGLIHDPAVGVYSVVRMIPTLLRIGP